VTDDNNETTYMTMAPNSCQAATNTTKY